VQSQTIIRSEFYQTLTTYAQKPLASAIAFVYDAALLILNTPDIFDSNPSEVYNGITLQSGDFFGLSGWLTIEPATGFRSSGDFLVSQIVPPNPFNSTWTELNYIDIDLHLEDIGDVNSNYYDVTTRQIGNYIIGTSWAANCTNSWVEIYTRNISRQNAEYNFTVSYPNEYFLPLYDSLIVYYVCDGEQVFIYCPSALYGSDTQCEISAPGPWSLTKKRAAPPATKPAVCQPATSKTGCVSSAGKPVDCPAGQQKPCSDVLVKKCCDDTKSPFCCGK